MLLKRRYRATNIFPSAFLNRLLPGLLKCARKCGKKNIQKVEASRKGSYTTWEVAALIPHWPNISDYILCRQHGYES